MCKLKINILIFFIMFSFLNNSKAENKSFYDDKINTAKFYFDKVFPRVEQHYKSAISGSSNIMNFKFN